MRLEHVKSPTGLSGAVSGSLHNEDCRALETAVGAAGYFPFGFVFRPYPASSDKFFTSVKGQKRKPMLSGWRGRPLVFLAPCSHATRCPEKVN